MYHVTTWFFRFVRGIILVFSLVALTYSIYLMGALVFNFPVSFKSGERSWWTVGNFNLGMPVKATLNSSIPDSIVSIEYPDGTAQQINYYPGIPHNDQLRDDRVPVNTDIIWVKYHQYEKFDKSIHPLNIATLDLNEGTVFIRPQNFKQKMVFGLPHILYVFMLGLLFMQTYRLLTTIYKRNFFESRNYRLLYSMGWILIAYNVIVYILEKIRNSSNYIVASFKSSIQDYRAPFEVTGILQSSVSGYLIMLAIILFAFAKAFKIGYHIQKDQPLTF